MSIHKVSNLIFAHSCYEIRIFRKKDAALSVHGYLFSLLVANGKRHRVKNVVKKG